MTVPSITYKSLDFIGFPKYRVGDDSSIWSSHSGHWQRLKPAQCRKTKRLIVSLCHGGKSRSSHVHTLVLLAFVGPRPEGAEACHFPDRNPANCNLTNLRWGSSKDNHSDAVIHGTKGPGELHPRATITAEIVLAIRAEADAFRRKGWRGWRFVLARKYGMTDRCLKHIIDRTSWKHV